MTASYQPQARFAGTCSLQQCQHRWVALWPVVGFVWNKHTGPGIQT
ncbi:MAG: hypothetical protein JNL39_00600 [Opitutaceae bacterium]|nr:hypothetical protein [Opitutaceae bacterium]